MNVCYKKLLLILAQLNVINVDAAIVFSLIEITSQRIP